MEKIEKHIKIDTMILKKKLNFDNIEYAFSDFLNNIPSIQEIEEFNENSKNRDFKTTRLYLTPRQMELLEILNKRYNLNAKNSINLILTRAINLPSLRSIEVKKSSKNKKTKKKN